MVYYPAAITNVKSCDMALCFCITGFTVDASKFFIFLLTLTLTSITGTSQAFAISSRLRVVAVANLLIALSFVLFMVRRFQCGAITAGLGNLCV